MDTSGLKYKRVSLPAVHLSGPRNPGAPKIVFVVPTYGAYDYAEKAIRSAVENTHSLSPVVYVYDDAFPDQAACDRFGGWFLGAQIEHNFPGRATRFHENGGLTRSWNVGLVAAREYPDSYACVTNSDVIFAPGWDVEIVKALERYDLVGPVTNAPGTERDQFVKRYSVLYDKPSDDPRVIKGIQDELHASQAERFKPSPLNGFCMIAKTATWWDNAFDGQHVFRPRNDVNSEGKSNPTPLMTLQEYEFQRRLQANGKTSAIVQGSYVFHYRSVSRGAQYKKGDWMRLESHRGKK